jgi:hypothetical protein
MDGYLWIILVFTVFIFIISIVLMFTEDNERFIILTFLSTVPLAVAFVLLTTPKPIDITGKNIEYKSISASNSIYYAIGADGSIYKIDQKQWADLSVPVIVAMK